MNLGAGLGIAVREFQTASGPIDYGLFVGRRLCGVIEAKSEGTTLSGFSEQTARYIADVPNHLVRDFRGAIQGRAERGIFLTTGTFTKCAREEAARENTTAIELVDIDRLLELLIEEGLGVRETKALTIDHDFFAVYRAQS